MRASLLLFFCLTLPAAANSSVGDECFSWFRNAKIKPSDTDCQEKCVTLRVDMGTYSCHEACWELCSSPSEKKCPANQHWVDPYAGRAYYRGNGTRVPAAKVKGQCAKNSPSYLQWIAKLLSGRPGFWDPKEETTPWTVEERERVIRALDEIPRYLKNGGIHGIYRMKKSNQSGNPASSNYSDIVLYDIAFGEKYSLARVLSHEFSHRVFEDLSESEQRSFRKAGRWKADEKNKGRFEKGRSAKQFPTETAMRSPTEDFADSVTEFVFQPEHLKKIFPPTYNWIQEHLGKKLNSGGLK